MPKRQSLTNHSVCSILYAVSNTGTLQTQHATLAPAVTSSNLPTLSTQSPRSRYSQQVTRVMFGDCACGCGGVFDWCLIAERCVQPLTNML